MEFTEFASAAGRIKAVDSDTETIARTGDLFEAAATDSPDTLYHVTHFIRGQAFAESDPRKLSIGDGLCHEAIARAASDESVTGDTVSKLVKSEGGIGEAIKSLDFGGQTGLGAFGGGGNDDSGVTVSRVAGVFDTLATTDGAGSEETKLRTLFGLFNDCTDDEIRYIAHILVGKMRIGVGNGTVRDAVSETFSIPVETVQSALQVANDYGLVAKAAATGGEEQLTEMELTVGRPVQSMLAQKGSAKDAIDAWGAVAVDPKYDGARGQVHYDGDSVKVFSRRMEDVTDAIPEVGEEVASNLDAPAILDGEVVAIDPDTGEPEPFEEVLRRFRRKENIQEMQSKVPVKFYPFDCIYYDGDSLLDDPFVDRADVLTNIYPSVRVAEPEVVESVDGIKRLEQKALDYGHEGVMLKNPESRYIPGERGKEWLKLKPDVETLDLVILGGEWGEGKRGETVGDSNMVGSILLGVRDGDTFESIGRIGTGLTDEELVELTERVTEHLESDDGEEFTVTQDIVVEVGYQDIQESPTYESGYALRFPRFLAFRDEKPVRETDDKEKVTRLYENQS